jgi:hypothetical protein
LKLARWVVTGLVAGGCAGPAIIVDDSVEVAAVQAVANPELDVLFVFGDEPSSAALQQRVVSAYPQLIAGLTGALDGVPSLHIATMTADLGTSASLTGPGPATGVGPGSCHGLGDGGALLSQVATSGWWVERGPQPAALPALPAPGAAGCAYQQPLRALRTALDGKPASAGFLRPSANLAVVIVADEDDCSIRDAGLMAGGGAGAGGLTPSWRCAAEGVICDEPSELGAAGPRTRCRPRVGSRYVDEVAPYAAYLFALKGDPRRVSVQVVAGPAAPFAIVGAPGAPTVAPSCAFSDPGGAVTGGAEPAVRLAALVDQLTQGGSPSAFLGACAAPGELAARIGRGVAHLAGAACLDERAALRDTSPAPGLQPSCEVVDVADDGGAPVALPPCRAGETGDCYTMIADELRCPASPGSLRLEVTRAARSTSLVWTHVRCQPAGAP